MSNLSDVSIDLSDPNGMLAKYVAAWPFRSATSTELVNEDNPFRRPVRPDDLGFLDFSKPLREARKFGLSSLIGHRMLRNIYDGSAAMFAASRSDVNDADRTELYSGRTRLLAAAAEQILTKHLFGLIDTDVDSGSASVADVRQALHDVADLRSVTGAAHRSALAATDATQAATFALIQYSAIVPSRRRAAALAGAVEFHPLVPAAARLVADDQVYAADAASRFADLLGSADLLTGPVAYWQFFLATSLLRAHYLHFTARDPRRIGEYLGATLHERISDALAAISIQEIAARGFGLDSPTVTDHFTHDDIDTVVDDVLVPLGGLGGPRLIAGFLRGIRNAADNYAKWDEDLATQISWADDIEAHKEKAEKLYHRIETDGIEVDLETFVESHEETSTTHVHNDTRLVVIESGQMHFWNNAGKLIAMNEGDKVLIPEFRLHGSMVLSGSCTYHQPIITEDLLAQV